MSNRVIGLVWFIGFLILTWLPNIDKQVLIGCLIIANIYWKDNN